MLHSADLNELLISNDLFYLLFRSLKFRQGQRPETLVLHQEQFPTADLSSKGQKGDRRQLPFTGGKGTELLWVVVEEEWTLIEQDPDYGNST